ncbi:hypothetical protein PSH87_11850 [Pseudomonas sp. FP453]|uniref:hypothetical protein n=1 Tax=Pseudomonas sp. FP453 TaxID=2954094 RepID=UPI0027344147|nr:hypothetical protein [Pseudomonas sp. FP453]WLH92609.1 hypothetical protein PSH87_11850 [Pseudomonas sp. FP453]
MSAPETSPSNSLRHFAVGVLCVAVLLGGYFMHINANADRQRAEAAERLLLCQQVERMAGAAASGGLKLGDSCESNRREVSGRMSQ